LATADLDVAFAPQYSQCFSSPLDSYFGGQTCLNVYNAFCYELKIVLGLGTKMFTGTFSIPELLFGLVRGTQSSVCLKLRGDLQGCSVCLGVLSYSFNESATWLNLCTDATVTCPGSDIVPQFEKKLSMPCFPIKHCEFLACPDNCNSHGICDNALGLCRCSDHFYGYDCGIEFRRTCMNSGTQTQDCWEKLGITTNMKDPTKCSVTISIGSRDTTVLVPRDTIRPDGSGVSSHVPLTHCGGPSAPISEQSIFKVYFDEHQICYYCAAYSNITYHADGSLSGCLEVEVWCDDAFIFSTPLECSTWAGPSSIQCLEPLSIPGEEPEAPREPPTLWDGKIKEDNLFYYLLVVGGVILCIVVGIALAALFIYKKKGLIFNSIVPSKEEIESVANPVLSDTDSLGSGSSHSGVELSDDSA